MIMTEMYRKFKNILMSGIVMMLCLHYLQPANAGIVENALKYFPGELFDTLYVENNLDEGEGSFRQAIQNSNEQQEGINVVIIRLVQDSDSVLMVKSPKPPDRKSSR
ncbi:MAG TPA: hypothetical protein DCX89_02475, partial [Saprospirales bacterium]|nr:hypothetical protein [Saprospirales bacterium]